MFQLSRYIHPTFIYLTWRPPKEPNGLILNYEIAYSVNKSDPIRVNITGSHNSFNISSLVTNTVLSVSIGAYTVVGRGPLVNISHIETNNSCKFIIISTRKILVKGLVNYETTSYK